MPTATDSRNHPAQPALKLPEFVAMMALMMALIALSMDAMLPALPRIGRDLGVADLASTQTIITFLVLGTGVGQMVFGPLSDTLGRKRAMYIGLACFMAGSLLCMLARSMEWMLIGRLIQGFGVSAPRIISIALVRDQFVGRAMAQVMSFIMMVFILVPMIAPAIGQVIILYSSWRTLFGLFVVLAVVAGLWMGLRQPETLPPAQRHPFSWRRLGLSIVLILKTPSAMWITVSAGFVFSGFLTYLSSAQAIYQDIYGLGTLFPLYFAMLALSIGLASFANTRLVLRFGTRLISYLALSVFIAAFSLLLVLALFQDGIPALWQFMTLGAIGFFTVGLLIGNLNAMAMQPLGQVAGLGAAMVGSITNFIAVPLAWVVSLFYNATLVPLLVGFSLFGILALLCLHRGLATYVDE